VIWIPSAANIGYEPEVYAAELEIYRKSLANTYGVPDLQFLFAHPSTKVVEGVKPPADANAKYVTFDQWPKSLADLATELAGFAKK
ncbi:MAG: hypothetical protein MK006_15185, partial [Pirellulales bacterium]|nr:hypothetical protein [Pirellulales bacterium]